MGGKSVAAGILEKDNVQCKGSDRQIENQGSTREACLKERQKLRDIDFGQGVFQLCLAGEIVRDKNQQIDPAAETCGKGKPERSHPENLDQDYIKDDVAYNHCHNAGVTYCTLAFKLEEHGHLLGNHHRYNAEAIASYVRDKCLL